MKIKVQHCLIGDKGWIDMQIGAKKLWFYNWEEHAGLIGIIFRDRLLEIDIEEKDAKDIVEYFDWLTSPACMRGYEKARMSWYNKFKENQDGKYDQNK